VPPSRCHFLHHSVAFGGPVHEKVRTLSKKTGLSYLLNASKEGSLFHRIFTRMAKHASPDGNGCI
jgi:hypothetical protein